MIRGYFGSMNSSWGWREISGEHDVIGDSRRSVGFGDKRKAVRQEVGGRR